MLEAVTRARDALRNKFAGTEPASIPAEPEEISVDADQGLAAEYTQQALAAERANWPVS
jgi:hypothetical protein